MGLKFVLANIVKRPNNIFDKKHTDEKTHYRFFNDQFDRAFSTLSSNEEILDMVNKNAVVVVELEDVFGLPLNKMTGGYVRVIDTSNNVIGIAPYKDKIGSIAILSVPEKDNQKSQIVDIIDIQHGYDHLTIENTVLKKVMEIISNSDTLIPPWVLEFVKLYISNKNKKLIERDKRKNFVRKPL